MISSVASSSRLVCRGLFSADRARIGFTNVGQQNAKHINQVTISVITIAVVKIRIPEIATKILRQAYNAPLPPGWTEHVDANGRHLSFLPYTGLEPT